MDSPSAGRLREFADKHRFHQRAQRFLNPAVAGVADPAKMRLILVHQAQWTGKRKTHTGSAIARGGFFQVARWKHLLGGDAYRGPAYATHAMPI